MKFKLLLLLIGFTTMYIQAQSQEEMEAWQEYMTPGQEHQWLQEMCGEWKGEITMWMSPEAEPISYEGHAVTQMILGGRYQETVFTGMFMGQPFEGRSLAGFDNAKKVFFATWIDNMGTGIMYTEGTFDKENNTLTQTGTMTDPTGKEIGVKEVSIYESKDAYTFKMYMTVEGEEFQTMEIQYQRIK